MTESYLSLFLNSAYSKGDLLAPVSLLFLFLARFLPILGQAPFFGARVLPNPTKVAFALTMYVIFLPHLLHVTTTPIEFNLLLVFYVLKEIFIGFAIGFLIHVPFVIAQAAGMLIDHQRGGASLMVNDPIIQSQSSPVGTLFNAVLIVIFYMINGPFLFIDAIMTSYDIIPPDQFINPNFFDRNSPFWDMQIKLFNTAMVAAIKLATPALIAILMTDVFLGIANRLAPQVQITFLGMPLKSLLGLAVVCFGWKLLTGEFATQSLYWLQSVVEFIKMLKP